MMQNNSEMIYLFLTFWNFNYIMSENLMLWKKVEGFENQKYEHKQCELICLHYNEGNPQIK